MQTQPFWGPRLVGQRSPSCWTTRYESTLARGNSTGICWCMHTATRRHLFYRGNYYRALQVANKPLLPGAAMLEACAAAAPALYPQLQVAALLHRVSIVAPLAIPAADDIELQLSANLETGSLDFRSVTKARKSGTATTLHCRASVGCHAALPVPAIQCDHSTAFWTDMTRHLVPQPSTGLPGCIASLECHNRLGGFAIGPAPLDNMLQLAAAFGAPKRGPSIELPSVPVGTQALLLAGNVKIPHFLYPTALLHGAHTERSCEFSHQLHGPVHDVQCQLTRLLVKQIAPRTAMQGTGEGLQRMASGIHPSSSAYRPDSVMYEAQWQVDRDVVQSVCIAEDFPCVHQLLLDRVDAQHAQPASARILGALQQASCVPKPSGSAVLQLQSDANVPPPASGVRTLPVVRSASVGALLKVAAAELPKTYFKSMTYCEWEPNNCISHSDLDSPNVTAGRTLLRAKLLCQPLALVPLHAHVAPRPRGSLSNMRLVQHGQVPAAGNVKVGIRCREPRTSQFSAVSSTPKH